MNGNILEIQSSLRTQTIETNGQIPLIDERRRRRSLSTLKRRLPIPTPVRSAGVSKFMESITAVSARDVSIRWTIIARGRAIALAITH